MRFLRKDKIKKSILVISDIHLGAGLIYNGQRNYLEDFHYDEEMVEFLNYYSSGDYSQREVELVINGDLFDFLAVPFVEYFDDEFWSEEASLEKLKIICEAHPEVIKAFEDFLLANKKNKINYIVGNHDAELIFKSLREYFLGLIDEKVRSRFEFLLDSKGEYFPVKGVLIKHGHEYEVAHHFDYQGSIAEDESGRKYFLPPWGSYYVTRVINKFKEDRVHINAVRPIRKFLINGLIYDTVFTFRFMLANAFYFVMVRFIAFFKNGHSIREMFSESLKELELFQDYEGLTAKIFEERKDVKCLIVGHTHEPILRSYSNGSMFINTGTWTNMYNLDFGKSHLGPQLTYAVIDVQEKDLNKEGEEFKLLNSVDVNLNVWKGRNNLPYNDFS